MLSHSDDTRMGEHVSSDVAQLCNESAKVQNSVVWGAPGRGWAVEEVFLELYNRGDRH